MEGVGTSYRWDFFYRVLLLMPLFFTIIVFVFFLQKLTPNRVELIMVYGLWGKAGVAGGGPQPPPSHL